MSDLKSSLTRAVHDNDISTVRSLIYSFDFSKELPLDVISLFGHNLLCDAVQMGHMDIVRELLVYDVPVNNEHKCDTATPLYLATKNNDMDMIDVLLMGGNADIFAKYNHENSLDIADDMENLQITGHSMDRIACVDFICNHSVSIRPSFIQCCQKTEEIVELFLGRDSKIPIDRVIKTRMLFLAIENEKINLIKLLLKLGADVNAEKDDYTVLQSAVCMGDLVMVEHILRFCPVVNWKTAEKTLLIAMKREYSHPKGKKILDALLEYGFSICPEYANNWDFIEAAIQCGSLKIVQTLLNYGAINTSYRDPSRTLLHLAVTLSRVEIAKALIKHGADVNEIKNNNPLETPLHYAVEKADVNMTKLLLASGAKMTDTFRLLDSAIWRGSSEIFEMLLQHDTKIDINYAERDCSAVLFKVIEGGVAYGFECDEPDYYKAKMVQCCLSRGSIVDAKRYNGGFYIYNALDVAIRCKLPKVVEVLLENGAEVDMRNDTYFSTTPLMIAIELNCFVTLNAILPSLPNFKVRDRDGKSALHYCDELKTSSEILLELLKYGADCYAMDPMEHTPSYINILETRFKINVYKRQMIKMQALKINVKSQNSQFSETYQKFYDDCRGEVKEMKSTQFGESILSVHDILTKDMAILAVYMKNRDILDALKTRDCVKKYVNMFPIYFGMMYYRLEKAIELEPLLKPISESLDYLIGFTLPYPVLMKLLAYIHPLDLNNLIRANPANTDW